jgi:hypothetical protein
VPECVDQKYLECTAANGCTSTSGAAAGCTGNTLGSTGSTSAGGSAGCTSGNTTERDTLKVTPLTVYLDPPGGDGCMQYIMYWIGLLGVPILAGLLCVDTCMFTYLSQLYISSQHH